LQKKISHDDLHAAARAEREAMGHRVVRDRQPNIPIFCV
jgi:hypothetical protein